MNLTIILLSGRVLVLLIKDNHFNENELGEKGEPVKQGFEYESGTNPHFLTVQELQEYGNH